MHTNTTSINAVRRSLTSNARLATIAIALLAIGFGVSIAAENFTWLNRFGSLVICVGVLVLARPMILGEDVRAPIYTEETGLPDTDPQHYETLGEPVPDWVKQDRMSRTAVGWLGPLIVFIGTVVNGFGDLLNKVACYGG
jgi:hypothetical protein